jgi:hypothetical protein
MEWDAFGYGHGTVPKQIKQGMDRDLLHVMICIHSIVLSGFDNQLVFFLFIDLGQVELDNINLANVVLIIGLFQRRVWLEWTTGSFGEVVLVPKIGNRFSRANPHFLLVALGKINEFGQARDAAGTSQSAVETNGHHFRTSSPSFFHQKPVGKKERKKGR